MTETTPIHDSLVADTEAAAAVVVEDEETEQAADDDHVAPDALTGADDAE